MTKEEQEAITGFVIFAIITTILLRIKIKPKVESIEKKAEVKKEEKKCTKCAVCINKIEDENNGISSK